MTIRKCYFFGVLCALLCVWSSFALGSPSMKSLTLKQIYETNAYSPKGIGQVRWINGGKDYTLLERNSEVGGKDVVMFNTQTGAKTLLVSAGSLIPPGKKQPLKVSGYQWSKDHKKLLIYTNTKRVWRYNTRGDYWVYNLKTHKLRRLGKTVQRATMMFATFSPDGSRVAFVSRRNLYVEDLSNGKTLKLTDDGGYNIVNGTADWMYEEEFGVRDGFRWSPDGKYIVYWQMNTTEVGRFDLFDNVSSFYPKIWKSIAYPMVGTKLASVRIGVVPSTGGKSKWFALPGNPRMHYVPRMQVVPNKDLVIIQQLNRRQNTNKVWIGNLKTMAARNILTEKNKDFLDVYRNIRWLDGSKYFVWTSERDGWRHLYRVSIDGKVVNKISKGKFDVVRVVGLDRKKGYVYYIASPENVTQRYLYRSNWDGSGQPVRVTPSNVEGWVNANVAPDGKYAIQTFDNVVTPPITSIISLPSNRTIRLLQENSALLKKYNRLGLNKKTFFQIKIRDAEGNVALNAWMIKPRGFDSAKKYPVIFYVYGEPAAATVQDRWNGGNALWSQYLAQMGFVVVSVDNRGSAEPRGKAWRNSIYKQLGIIAAQDQALAAQKIFTKFKFIDSSRVGIWGWSGGGQMTLNAMFRYPNIYKAGIAVSFVSLQRLYDSAYQERYMGLLQDNPKGYQDGSPITYAQNLKGALLIMHGTGDDNVHFQSFQLLEDKLIRNNKLFHMMTYPLRTHCICEGKNTTLQLRETMARFWKRNLLDVSKDRSLMGANYSDGQVSAN